MNMLPEIAAGATGAVSVAYVPGVVLPMVGIQPVGWIKHVSRGVTALAGSYVAEWVGGRKAGWAFFMVGSSVAFLGAVNEWVFGGAVPGALSYYPPGVSYYPPGVSGAPDQLQAYLNPAPTLEQSFGQDEYAYAYGY